MSKTLLASLAVAVLAFVPARAQDGGRYSRDLARRLYSAGQVSKALALPEAPVQLSPEPILSSRPIPLSDLPPATETEEHSTRTRNSWELPPFAEVGPPPPAGLSPEALERWKLYHEGGRGPQAPVFPGVSTETEEAPSAGLRPRTQAISQTARQEDFAMPTPFSALRFGADRKIFQLSLYGGTTSFAAEEAYVALRHNVEKREPLEGFGKEAFLGHVKEQEAAPEHAEDHAFSDLVPVGRKQPELTDPGIQAARHAPSFQDVPTTLHRTSGAYLPRMVAVPTKVVQPEYLIIVAYVPEKALTYELALDTRLGSMQNLLTIALAVQKSVSEL